MIQELDGNTRCIQLTEYDEDTHSARTCLYIDVPNGHKFDPNTVWYFRGIQGTDLSDRENTVLMTWQCMDGFVRFFGYVGFDTTISPMFCKLPDSWADFGVDPSLETTLAEYAEKNLQLGGQFVFPDVTRKPEIFGWYKLIDKKE